MSTQFRGKIIYYTKHKNFGFIAVKGQKKKIYFAGKHVMKGEELNKGDLVKFECDVRNHNIIATNVKKLDKLVEGIIQKYFIDKGYGFIRTIDGDDLFFHIKKCKSKFISEGDRVRFEVAKSKKGLYAVNVEKINDGK